MSLERNLPASPRKLAKAREDGQAARSRELSHLAVLGMGAIGVYFGAPFLVDFLLQLLDKNLVFDANTVVAPGLMVERLRGTILFGVVVSLAFSVLTLSAVLAAAISSGGWVWSLKPIQPQFSRLNPLKGVGNLFSKQQIINVVKMVILTGILGTIAGLYLERSFGELSMLVLQPSPTSLRYAAEWIVKGAAMLLLVVFIVSLIDVPLQRFLFKSRLKMSHQEVKQEHKDIEGNALVKSQIRRRMREMINSASVSAVPKADFVVTNPTHYAVALRYDDQTMHAPQVISKGTDLIALRIREMAQQHNVPVLESPRLARALYAHAELEQPIPATLYTAVAQVLAYVYRLRTAMKGEGPMPDVLPEPPVPEELDPHFRHPPVAPDPQP